MPSTRQTYPVEFKGGLVTNMSPLQQGINAPGSARILRNFEPSVEGGYRRVEGYTKYNSNIIPPYGAPVVNGDSQTGGDIDIANVRTIPEVNDTFKLIHATAQVNGAITNTTTLVVDTIVGTITAGMDVVGTGITSGITVSAFNSGTSTVTLSSALTLSDDLELTFSEVYTVSSVTASSTTEKTASVNITPNLRTSPTNGDSIEFLSTISNYLTLGCGVFLDRVIVAKNDSIYKMSSTSIDLISKPNYGTVLVNGAGQSGSNLIVDGLTAAPQANDIFKIAGVDKIYRVTANATVSSGGATLAISPALPVSAPANDAAITFLSTSRESAGKTRFSRYNYTGTEKIVIVDGTNYPALYDNNNFTVLNSGPADVLGASFVVSFKNQLFFGKSNLLTFTAPYKDNDFTAAAGSGTISLGASITGLIVFRQQLIIFTESSIFQLVGNTISDFQLQPVTTDIGCVDTDTIQEVGGDVMFLGPDGLRLLSATDRIGDFGLAVVSKAIQNEATNFITTNTSFASVVIRNKSQYRILGYNTNITQENAQGILGTQFAGQGGDGMAWSELRGIRAYVADSRFYQNAETVVFSNDDGYLYQMEDGNSFDGLNIQTTFATPYMPINDPRIRKTFYKAFLYTDPQGSVSFEMSLKLDFDQRNSIQPIQINFNNSTGEVAFYGSAEYFDPNEPTVFSVYSNKLLTLFETQLIGSGFTASIQFESDSTDPPFSLDAITLEHGTNTRR